MEEEAEFRHESDENGEEDHDKSSEGEFVLIGQNAEGLAADMINDMADSNDNEEEDDHPGTDDLNVPFIAAASAGNFSTVQSLLEQGADKNETTNWGRTAMWHAARNDHLPIVQLLVEQGADMEKVGRCDATPLWVACAFEQVDVVRYLLEQGADRDWTDYTGDSSLHIASTMCNLKITKLLMVYGADLNARNNYGQLPIDIVGTEGGNEEEIEDTKQAIRDEPRRRMDEVPGKRATEQDRHPNAAVSASAQEDEEPSSKRARLEIGEEEGKVAEEDEDSEPSDGEDD